MKFIKVIYEIFSLIYSTEGRSTDSWIKMIFKQPPKIKTFRNVLQRSTMFHSRMFYKVLPYSILDFFKIRHTMKLVRLFLLIGTGRSLVWYFVIFAPVFQWYCLTP